MSILYFGQPVTYFDYFVQEATCECFYLHCVWWVVIWNSFVFSGKVDILLSLSIRVNREKRMWTSEPVLYLTCILLSSCLKKGYDHIASYRGICFDEKSVITYTAYIMYSTYFIYFMALQLFSHFGSYLQMCFTSPSRSEFCGCPQPPATDGQNVGGGGACFFFTLG